MFSRTSLPSHSEAPSSCTSKLASGLSPGVPLILYSCSRAQKDQVTGSEILFQVLQFCIYELSNSFELFLFLAWLWIKAPLQNIERVSAEISEGKADWGWVLNRDTRAWYSNTSIMCEWGWWRERNIGTRRYRPWPKKDSSMGQLEIFLIYCSVRTGWAESHTKYTLIWGVHTYNEYI